MFRAQIFLFFFISFIVLQMFPHHAVSRSERDNIRYISDVLVINIKDNLEKPYEVVATVQSDDPVKIIEESGNYFKIETADSKRGWISKHYLKSETPKTLLVKQLKQEISDLKGKDTAKSNEHPDESAGVKSSNTTLCLEIQQKLSAAEKHVTQLQEELQAQQHRSPDSASSLSRPVIDENPVSTEHLEQTPENYALLISEYEIRGQLIADLQKTISKKDDQTRFLWFGAGAAVFLIGMLAGKTSNRKKNKFTY